MFRENVLVNQKLIERVSKTMIPVALDYQKVLDRESPEAKFLLPLMKQRDQEQGLWIFSPQGKALGGFEGFGDMLGKTRREIESALKTFGPVKTRNVAKGSADKRRGVGFGTDGKVCLAEYVRRRDKSNISSPVISSVVLSAKEFTEFAPRKGAKVGQHWELSDSVAKKLCRVASPMCYQHAPQPKWVKDIELTGQVVKVDSGLAELTFKGRMKSERLMRNRKILSEQKLALKGQAVYDLKSGKMKSLLIVGDGTFRWPEEAPDRPIQFDAIIEWKESKPASK